MRQMAYSETLTPNALWNPSYRFRFCACVPGRSPQLCAHAEIPIHTLQMLLDSPGANAKRLADFLI